MIKMITMKKSKITNNHATQDSNHSNQNNHTNQSSDNGWEIKRLGEVCDKASSNVSQNQLANENGDYPIYGASGIIKNVSFYHQNKEYVSIIKDGAGIGRIALLPAYSSVIGTLQYLIPKACIDICYFFYFLSSVDFLKYKNGSTIPHIYFKDYSVEPIFVPPLPEQQRIVSILDKVFAAIAKAKANSEQNLKNAKQLFESYLQSVFENKGENWEEMEIGEVLKKTENVDPTKYPNNEFTYLDVSSVNKDTKEIENVTLMMGKDAPSRARKLIKTNDVIFATVRPTHSRVALITEEYDEQVCSTGYIVLRTKEFINCNLVFYFLLTFWFNKQMEKLQKGASYPAVTDSEVKGIIITFPKSLTEQKSIVQKLDALSAETKKLEAIYQKKIADLEELKKSVLQKAFSGQL